MVYGLICDVRQRTSMELLLSKKINKNNIADATQMGELLQRLNRGDVVWVVSVKEFGTVSLFYLFACGVVEKGAVLRIMKEPYLEAGNGKIWRDSVREHIQGLAEIEQQAVKRLLQTFNFNTSGKNYVAGVIAEITVSILSATYSQEGILRRG